MTTDNIFDNDILNGDLTNSLVPELGQENILIDVTPSETSLIDPLSQELSLIEPEQVIDEIDIDNNSINNNTSSFDNIAIANIDPFIAANPEEFQVNEIDVNDTSFAPPQSELEFQGGFGDVDGGSDVTLEIEDGEGNVVETFRLTGEGQASLYRDEEYQYVFFRGVDETTKVDIDSTSNIKFGNYIGDSLKIETTGSIEGGDVVLNEPDETGLILKSGMENSSQENLGYAITELKGFRSVGSQAKYLDINNLSQVVGQGLNGNILLHSDGINTDLGFLELENLEHLYSQPTSINDLGQIAGYSAYRGQGERAFVYSDGEIRFPASLGAIGYRSKANDINNFGTVVGQIDGVDNYDRGVFGFVLNNDSLALIEPIDRVPTFDEEGQIIYTSGASISYGINDFDMVVGVSSAYYSPSDAYSAQAYSSVEGSASSIGYLSPYLNTPNPFPQSYSFGINNRGQIVGYSSAANSSHAFLYEGGSMTDIGVLPGHYRSEAWDINDLGQIIGISIDRNDRFGFVYQDGQMYDLNDLIPEDSGWIIEQPEAINNKGQIVGFGKQGTRETAFLLDPIVSASESRVTVGKITTFGDTVLLQGNEITLSGNAITTQGGDIEIDGATKVDSNLIINSSLTEEEVITDGGDINFTGTLDSSAASGNLRLQAGTGNILFGETVGGEATFRNINVLGADIVTATADITSNQSVRIDATSDVVTQNLTSDNGRIVVSSQQKSISTLDITSGGEEKDNIVLQAGDSISAVNLSGNELGVVKLVSGTYLEEDSGVAGNITTSSITGKRLKVESTGNFTAEADISTNDGNVVVDAKQDITVKNINANNGNVRLTSEEKSIATKDISTIIPEAVGDEETTRKGNIVLKAIEGVNAGNLNANESGKVEITSGEIVENDTETIEDDTVIVGDIATQSITGRAVRAVGTGSFTATGDITAHDGRITVAVTDDINTKNINSLAKSINLISTEGAVTVDGDLNSEKGGVAIHAANDIETQKIRSFDGAVALSSYDGQVTVEDDIDTVRGGVTIAAKEGVEVARITTGVGEVNIGSGKSIVASGNISTNVGYVNLKAGGSLNLQSVTTNDGYISLGADSNVEVSSLATGSGVINLISATGSVAAGNIDTEGSYVAIEAALNIIASAIEANGGGINLIANSDFGGATLTASGGVTDAVDSLNELIISQQEFISEIVNDLIYHRRDIAEFILGVLYETAANNLEDAFNIGQFILPYKLTERDKRYWNQIIEGKSDAFQLGRELADAASIIQGMIELFTGGAAIASASSLCLAGAGATLGASCFAAAPAIASGAALSAHGLSLIKNGLENDTDANLIDDLLAPQNMASSGGSNAARGIAQKIGASPDRVDNALEVLGSKKIEQLEGRLNFTETRFRRDTSGQLVETKQDVKLLNRVLDKSKELIYNVSKSFDVVGGDVDSINDIRGTIRQNRIRPDKPQLINDTELNTALTDHNNFIGKYKDRVSGAYANRFGRARSSELDNIQAQGELNTATDILDGNTELGNNVKMRGLPEKTNTQKNPDYLAIMPDGDTRIVEVKTLTGKVTDRKLRINLGKAIDQIDNNISTINPTKNGYVRLDFSNADFTTQQPDGWLKKIKNVFDSNTRGIASVEFVEVFYRNDANQVQKLLIQVKNGVVDLVL